MKKKYVKPELFYEHYELSQHIADCAWEWESYTSKETCFAKPDPDKLPTFAGLGLFTAQPTCTLPSDWYSDYCYQNGAPGANLYKS